MRLGDYYEGYYKGYYAYLAPGTARGYDGDWRNHIADEFAAWEMEDIRVRHINAWLASDHFAGVPGAARSAYKTLRQILRSAPDRAPTILTGLIILNTVLKAYEVETVSVSSCGVREGYLLDRVVGRQKDVGGGAGADA